MSSSPSTPLVEAACLDELGPVALLDQAAETECVLREAEVHRLRIAYQWAITHPALDPAHDPAETPSGAVLPGVLTTPETLGGPGTPAVAAFTPEPLAVALACSPAAAAVLMADALDLAHRLPLLWDQTQTLLVPVWKARRVAAATRDLSVDAARWVDRQVAGRVSSLGPAALDRLVAHAAARCESHDLVDRESRARDSWDVTLTHPHPNSPDGYAGTSHLHAVGDTLDLTRFHDVVCAEAEALAVLGDTDHLGARKAKALGLIADAQARLDLTSLLHQAAVAGESDPTSRPIDPAAEHARLAALRRRDAKVRLYLHASLTDVLADVLTDPTDCGDAIGTVEALGPVTLDRIRDWAGRSRLTIQPVLHVTTEDTWTVDRHDPPPPMADQTRLRDPACVFPWCTRPSRQCDLDHIQPYAHTDNPSDTGPPGSHPPGSHPPGSTTPANLAPLCRRHHRAKTTSTWTHTRTDPGTYLWTGPAGVSALVTPRGTINLPRN